MSIEIRKSEAFTLLLSQRRVRDAARSLRQGLQGLEGPIRESIEKLLEDCAKADEEIEKQLENLGRKSDAEKE